MYREQPVLECKQLLFKYEESSSAFFNFSLQVPKNHFLVIVGASGSGKSTFFSLLAGFLKPLSGQLIINQKVISNEPPSKRDLAILFQSHNLFPHLTVFQNVALGLNTSLRLSQEEKEDIFILLEELDIAKIAHKEAGCLSGGEMQRASLARSLLRKKPLLLLDEPFASLDPDLREKGHELLYTQAKSRGISVLFITHFPNEVLHLADSMVKIENGSIHHQELQQEVFVST